MVIATIMLIGLVTASISSVVYRETTDRVRGFAERAEMEAGLAVERSLQARINAALEGGATLGRRLDTAEPGSVGSLEAALGTMLALSPEVRQLSFQSAAGNCVVMTRQRSGDPYAAYSGAALGSATASHDCPEESATGPAGGHADHHVEIALVHLGRTPENRTPFLQVTVPAIGEAGRVYGSLTVTARLPEMPGLAAADSAENHPTLFIHGPAPEPTGGAGDAPASVVAASSGQAPGVETDRQSIIQAEPGPGGQLGAAAMAAWQSQSNVLPGRAIAFDYGGVAHIAHLMALEGQSRDWLFGIVHPAWHERAPIFDLLYPISSFAVTLAALAGLLVLRFADRLCGPMDTLACRVKAIIRGTGEPETGTVSRFLEIKGLQQAVNALDAEIAYREKRHSLVARGRHDGLFDYDFVNDRCFASCRMAEIVGRSEEVLLKDGRAWLDFLHADDRPAIARQYESFLAGHSFPFEAEARVVRSDGTWRWVHVRAWAVRGESDAAGRVVGLMEDVTERKETEDRLLHNAFHDSLTGLANRVLFMERLDWALNQVKANGALASAVLYLDLDRFKAINDTLGQAAGDDMLITIARRLEEAVGEGSFVARLGSDQFAALDTEVHDRDRALTFARRVRTALMAPIMLSGQEVFPTASIGIALCTAGYSRPESVLADASLAMTRAKARGTGQTLMFERGMRGAVLGDALTMETDLRHALERQEISLVYQPIVCLGTGRTAGFEALMRWTHPERGPVSPGLFIPLAEDTGLIQTLGAWAIDEACRQWTRWLGDRGATAGHLPYISVNVSLRQLEDGQLSDRVAAALSSHRVPAKALHLEVTESLMMDGQDRFARLLGRLKDTGVHLSLDDFGIGYSSLSRLHRLPFDTLKIDRSFVSDILTNGNSELVVGAIVDLAHSLGMAVIAEGAETEGDVEALSRADCDFCQGFVFSRPLPKSEAERCLDRLWQQQVKATAPQLLPNVAPSLKLVEPA